MALSRHVGCDHVLRTHADRFWISFISSERVFAGLSILSVLLFYFKFVHENRLVDRFVFSASLWMLRVSNCALLFFSNCHHALLMGKLTNRQTKAVLNRTSARFVVFSVMFQEQCNCPFVANFIILTIWPCGKLPQLLNQVHTGRTFASWAYLVIFQTSSSTLSTLWLNPTHYHQDAFQCVLITANWNLLD